MTTHLNQQKEDNHEKNFQLTCKVANWNYLIAIAEAQHDRRICTKLMTIAKMLMRSAGTMSTEQIDWLDKMQRHLSNAQDASLEVATLKEHLKLSLTAMGK